MMMDLYVEAKNISHVMKLGISCQWESHCHMWEW